MFVIMFALINETKQPENYVQLEKCKT